MHSLPMRVLGIDPGLATIGIGLVDIGRPGDAPTVIEWLTIETDAGAPLTLRLHEIDQDLRSYIGSMKPDIAVIERLFFQTNRKTAMDVAQARGVILAALGAHHISVIEPTPLEVKHAITGDGRADKRQMQEMVTRVLKLTEIPTPDDAADALALALYGCVCGHALHALS